MRRSSRNEKPPSKNESKKKSSRKKLSIASVDSSEMVLLKRYESNHLMEIFLSQNQKKPPLKSMLLNDRKNEIMETIIAEEIIINLDAMEKMVKKIEAIKMDNDQTEIIRMEIIIVRNNQIKTEANSFRFFKFFQIIILTIYVFIYNNFVLKNFFHSPFKFLLIGIVVENPQATSAQFARQKGLLCLAPFSLLSSSVFWRSASFFSGIESGSTNGSMT